MDIKEKIGTATKILNSEGLISLLKAFLRYLGKRIGLIESDDSFRPEESKMAFQALSASSFKGLMIDVGAHDGSILTPFADSGWQVLAFEPDSKNREELIKSFGDSQNVIIDSRAISDHVNEKAVLYRSEESTGVSGLSPFLPSHQVAEEIEVTTLENVFNEQGLTDEEVHFLKIDTEGFDFHVLRGYPWLRSSPDLILCEFEDSKTVPLGYTFHDLADFLLGKGYNLIVSEWQPITRYGAVHDWRRFATYPCQLEDPQAWGNIFAAKEDDLFKALLTICDLES